MKTSSLLLAASGLLAPMLPAAGQATSFAPGAVYTQTNESTGNRVAVFERALDGVIQLAGYVPTGGTGTDMGLGNQGAVTLSDDERFLFVTNAGSSDLSVFRVLEDGLELLQVVPTGGQGPVSVAQRGDLVYVVHAGSDDIYGFRLSFPGFLRAMPGSSAPLSQQGTAPAQISFDPRGKFLYVTEKATNVIARIELDGRGLPANTQYLPSQGITPFGFAFGFRNQLFVSEATGGADSAGTVSSYRQMQGGTLDPISPMAPTGESATCWVVATPDGRIIYASNTASDSVSSFEVGFDGELTLLDPQAATTGASPLDMALTPDGRFFYVLNVGVGGIGDYSIGSNGELISLPGSNNGSLPMSASGLAAR